ncbi:MAG: sensor histidine kinase [Chitinophagaceae bacterium]
MIKKAATLKKCQESYWRGWSLMLSLFFPLLSAAQSSPAYRDSLEKIISTGRQDTAMVGRLNILASSYALSNSDTVLSIARRAYSLGKRLNYDKGVALALLIETKTSRLAGDYATALQKGLECQRTYEKSGAFSQAAFAEVEVGMIYKDMASDNKTMEYLTRAVAYIKDALDKFKKLQDTAGMVLSLNMSGVLSRDRAKTGQRFYYDTAFAYYNRAFALIARSTKGREYFGRLNNNISQFNLEYKKDYPKALEYLFKALAFNLAEKKVLSLSYNYGNISNAYVQLKDFKNAIKYARLMVATTTKENSPARIQNAYSQMYVAFQANGRMDSALRYYILYDSISDMLTNLSKSQQVMKLQLQFDTSKKESEITRLEMEGLSQKKSIMLLAGFLIFLIALAATIAWLYQRMKRQKVQIESQADRLQAVMKELHHRVKNNLQIVSSLLSLQTYKLQDSEAILVLKESQQRVQAMSLIHQRLYTTDLLTAVNMKEYITDLAETLLASYGFGRDDFNLDLKIENEILDVEKALPIGLLINELVSNALKYAYKNISLPSLTISLTNCNEQLTLVVKDNGEGINVEEWKMKGSSFGKQLIKVLGKQLRASQTVDGQNGTSFTIVIPNQAA